MEADSRCYDEDGRVKRTGTMWTASAHIVTAVIGSGVLSLAWAIAQLGWVIGPAVMLLFSLVTYCTSALLADCYRSGDPSAGTRNYTYTDTVNTTLGGIRVHICGFLQYATLVAVAMGYTLAASLSMMAIKRANGFHEQAHRDPCSISSSTRYVIIFGVAEIFFSQIPDLDKVSWLSVLAAVMSFTYSSIGFGLALQVIGKQDGFKGSLTGVSIGEVTPMEKMWRSLQAVGDIAFSYSYSLILVDIQDTIRAPPPSEAKVMRRATVLSVAVTTLIYLLCGCMGYAAFGDDAPRNLLTGFAAYEPFWLLDVANAAIVVHHLVAYQVHSRALFAFVEKWAKQRWPESRYVTGEVEVPVLTYRVNLLRATWRSAFVVATTVVSMLLPFLGDVVALLCAIAFWPLTLYFPVQMYIAKKAVPTWSMRWVCLQLLSLACLTITVAAAAGYVAGMISDLKSYKPFATTYSLCF
ncbi:hypothetical protein ACP70R_035990 [Stipagrostis hirtigluma subsp. patula]